MSTSQKAWRTDAENQRVRWWQTRNGPLENVGRQYLRNLVKNEGVSCGMSQNNDLESANTCIEQWLLSTLDDRFKLGTRLDVPVSAIDEEELYPLMVQATIELFDFRPTTSELKDAFKSLKLQTFKDCERVIGILRANQPQERGFVSKIDKMVQSQIWSLLISLPNYRYNDQFALKCLINSKNRTGTPHSFSAILESVSEAPYFWSSDLEALLSKFGYQPIAGPDFDECSAQAGDILRLSKYSELDTFTEYVLVSDSVSGLMSRVQFKPTNCSPRFADRLGFKTFYLRDPEIVLEQAWRPGPAQQI